MTTDVSSVTRHFPSAEGGFSTTLASAISPGATTVELSSVAGYTNGEIAVFIVDPNDSNKKQVFTGVIATANNTVTNVVWTSGTNQSHALGATVVDYATATHISMVSKGLLVEHNQDGTHGAITATSLTTDTVNEETTGAGVTIDGLKLKDSKLATNDSVVTSNITDKAVTSEKQTTTVAFEAHSTSTVALSTGVTKMTWNSELYDLGSDFDLANNRFVAPYDGIYYFTSHVNLLNTNEGANVRFYLNGAHHTHGHLISADAVSGVIANVVAGSAQIKMTAGDYVEVYIDTDDGGDTEGDNLFSGFLVGRV